MWTEIEGRRFYDTLDGHTESVACPRRTNSFSRLDVEVLEADSAAAQRRPRVGNGDIRKRWGKGKKGNRVQGKAGEFWFFLLSIPPFTLSHFFYILAWQKEK